MSTKQHPIIAREGWGRLALITAVALVLYFGLEPMAAIPAMFYLAFTLYQFRDPSRTSPSIPLAVVAPIHGRVTEVDKTKDPWLERDALVVTIHGSLLDIRSLYSPTEGKIVDQWRTQDAAQIGNAVAYWIQTDEDDDVVLEIQPRGQHGPMTFRYNPGERVGQGRRVGYVNNGCIAKVYLPATSLVEVQPDMIIDAGVDVLARFVHLTNMASAQQ